MSADGSEDRGTMYSLIRYGSETTIAARSASRGATTPTAAVETTAFADLVTSDRSSRESVSSIGGGHSLSQPSRLDHRSSRAVSGDGPVGERRTGERNSRRSR